MHGYFVRLRLPKYALRRGYFVRLRLPKYALQRGYFGFSRNTPRQSAYS
jgi:hypothetical protein